MTEKVFETKKCKKCWASFSITDKDLEFYEKVSPVFNWKKYLIPSPTFCPWCRKIRRLSFRNERKLYKINSHISWKPIISCYHPDSWYKVVSGEEFWSDSWTWMDFGRDFDFSRWFFEQFGELMKDVPRMSLLLVNLENSDYNNYASYLKNCYLNFDSYELEDCYYCYNTWSSKNCVDCSIWKFNENCYETINCVESFNIFHSINSSNCNDSYYLMNCKWCTDCIWCVNLVNAQYCIFNEQLTEEQYVYNKHEFLDNIEWLKKKFNKLVEREIHCSSNFTNVENCEWDNLSWCKNSMYCFDSTSLDNCKYVTNCTKLEDCYDYESWPWPCSLSMELNWTMNCHKSAFWIICWWENLYYCDHCTHSKNLFWCVWLNNKEYCIFNKQYSKEEYEELVWKIIDHMISRGDWWEFFPSEISPFWYNETCAMDELLLTKEIATNNGYKRQDKEIPINVPDWIEKIEAKDLPKDANEIDDSIVNKAIICEKTWRLFRFVKQELDFYRKHNLLLPKRHPDQRHLDRLLLRNPKMLFERKCDNCMKDIKSTFSPDRSEIVYCEECFNKEIYE